MKKLFKWFRRPKYITPEFKTNVEVLTINDHEGVVMSESVGITKDRETEIMNIALASAKRIAKKEAPQYIVFQEMSKHCKHPNELAFMYYSFGFFVARTIQPMGFIVHG